MQALNYSVTRVLLMTQIVNSAAPDSPVSRGFLRIKS